MRIAIVTEVFVPKIDGITNRLKNTIECFVAMGHEVLVIAPDNATDHFEGARVVRIPSTSFPPYPGLRLGLPDPRIALELRRFGAHVVHVVGPACLGIWGIASARFLGLPVVASYHTDLPAYANNYGLGWAEEPAWALIRAVHNAAHLNLCPSSHTRDELLDHGIRNVGIWRGGVDTELFHPERRSDEMRLELSEGEPDAPLLLYAGRVAPEKGLTLFETLLDHLPEARGAIVGDGPAREELMERMVDRPVSFPGFLRGERLASAMASADVFVMPSTTETLGFVVLEAMSCGTPVVAARAGGVPDLVTHGENGLLFDPSDPQDAVGHLKTLLERRSMLRFYSQQARKRAEGCDWTHETRGLLDDYRRAIAINRQRGPLGRLHLALVG